ncbi:MAG: hypothetical protein KKB20_21755 [Proteobacteria bacterium]|nr:hypothetical protein [Pseudomonadota bacterium]
MGSLIGHILKPGGEPAGEPHLTDQDLARLAEGRVSSGEREAFSGHLNRCERCYEIFSETLADASEDAAAKVGVAGRLKAWQAAAAASILIALLIGGGLYYRVYQPAPQMPTASLAVDPELKALLLENEDLNWRSKDRIARLAGLLRQRGVRVKDLDKVVMVAAYQPSKSFIAPREVLRLRIENGVAYLEVIEAPPADSKR